MFSGALWMTALKSPSPHPIRRHSHFLILAAWPSMQLLPRLSMWQVLQSILMILSGAMRPFVCYRMSQMQNTLMDFYVLHKDANGARWRLEYVEVEILLHVRVRHCSFNKHSSKLNETPFFHFVE